MLGEVAGREREYLLLVERRLRAEVKDLEPLHKAEAGERRSHRDVLRRLRRDLFAEHAVEQVDVGEVLGGRAPCSAEKSPSKSPASTLGRTRPAVYQSVIT